MTADTPTPTWGRWVALGAALAAVAIQLPFFDRWFGLLDEGYMLSLADDIRRGQMLYRDVYVDAPFPASFYVLAGWFGLLGTSVWAERVLAVVLFAVFVGASVRLATLALPRAGAVAFAVLLLCYRIWAFPHWQIYSYSSLAVTLLSLSALAIAAAGPRSAAWALLGAGMLAGAAVLSKQDYGVACTGALGLYLLCRWLPVPDERDRVGRGLRDGVLLGLGAAMVILPVLGVIAANGAWDAFVYQTVVSPLTSTRSGVYVELPPLLPLFQQDTAVRNGIGSYLPAILQTLRWEGIAAGPAYRDGIVWDVSLKLLFHAPFVVWWTAAFWWTLRLLVWRRPPATTQLLIFAYAGGFLLAFNTPRDWVHLMMVYPPALLLGCVLASDVVVGFGRTARVALAAPAVVAIGVLVVHSARLARELRAGFQTPIAGPRGGVYADATYGPLLDDVLRTLAALPPGVPVPVYPIQPMIGFLADRPTVGGYHVIWPFQSSDRDRRIIEAFERERVPLVVYSLSQYAHLGSFEENAPRLFEYLVDHYDVATTFHRKRWGPLLVALARDDGGRDSVLPALVAQLPPDGSAAAATWPFAHVLAERVGTAAAPVRVTVPFQVPADGTRLEFVYGINPDRWLTLLDGPFTFRIEVDGRPRFEGLLDPARVLDDRRWAAGSVDLTAQAGGQVQLTFHVEGPASLAGDRELAGWARFRMLTQPLQADRS